MKKLGLIQSRGLGDLIIALPIAGYYKEQDYEIYWPICQEFFPSMESAAPWVNWIPMPTDKQGHFFYNIPMEALKQIGCDLIIPLYNALTNHPEFGREPYFQHTKFDQYKYIRAGVPFLNKWRLNECITRDHDRESQVLDKIRSQIGDKPYILVHVQGSDHRARFDPSVIPEGMPAIEINELTDRVWDWLLAIENATAVIFTDSVYSNIVDQLQLLDDDSRYLVPRSHIGLTPVLGCHWNWIENLDLPKRAVTIKA